MELYGTYLLYLIKRELKNVKKPLSVKEIGVLIYIHESKREQFNFERRIRVSIKKLIESENIIPEAHRTATRNILTTKYIINE